MIDRTFRVRAEIDLEAIRKNIIKLNERKNPDCLSCAVVKADGYGHGAVRVSLAIYDLVDFYAVATIDEAEELRNAGIDKPILILGYIHESANEAAVKLDVRITVFSFDMAKKISETAKRAKKGAKIHIKIDTGMNRIGFKPDKESIEEILKISSLPGIEIEGIFTHLYLADGKDKTLADAQVKKFKDFTDELNLRGQNIPIKHCSNSAASTDMPYAGMDMIRLGISMYGLYPSEYVKDIKLNPAMDLKSHIVMIKTIHEGESVGYGATFTAKKDTVIATVPVGYADGYKRTLSNKGSVLIKGQRARVAGRVCMDQFMVDITNLKDVSLYDEVTLVGKDGTEEITMEEISELASSFNYEFACSVSKRVPRVYIS